MTRLPGLVLVLLPLGAVAATPTSAEWRACGAVADAGERLACYDRLAQRLATSDEAAERFGLHRSQDPPEPEALRSRIVGPFDGWERGRQFRLENGQVWRASGDDQAYYPSIPDGPAVTIRRSVLGAYWMEVEGITRRIKVRRVR